MRSKGNGFIHFLPFERNQASTPELISIVFCQHSRFSMVYCTRNLDFEVKPLDWLDWVYSLVVFRSTQ